MTQQNRSQECSTLQAGRGFQPRCRLPAKCSFFQHWARLIELVHLASLCRCRRSVQPRLAQLRQRGLAERRIAGFQPLSSRYGGFQPQHASERFAVSTNVCCTMCRISAMTDSCVNMYSHSGSRQTTLPSTSLSSPSSSSSLPWQSSS